MENPWRKRRKSIFIYAVSIILLAFISIKVYPYLNPAPSCYDSKMNGDEFGVDCGGSCQLACHEQILIPEVKFSRAVKTEDNLYDVMAMIENKNLNISVADNMIDYEFSIYDKYGRLVSTVYSSSTLPIGQIFPVIIQNVPIKLSDSSNYISKVICKIYFNTQNWNKVDSVFSNNFFSVNSKDFIQNNNNISQLTISLKNITKSATFINVPVRIILSDENNNVVAVNETILKNSKFSDSNNLYFSWRVPLDIENPKIDVYPIISPNTEFK